MREVVIQSWCDECLAHGDHTPAEPIDITWRNRDVSLDLCDTHAAPFHELDRLITEHGHTRKTKPAKPAKKPTTPHPPTPAQGAAPNSTNEESTAFLRDDGNYHCPDCDRSFDRAQSLGAHRYRHHGYKRDRG